MAYKQEIDTQPPNPLCSRCYKKCKQPAYMVLIKCPKFEPQPVQLEVPLGTRGRPRKGKF